LGRLLLLNFGTFAETNKFKAAALSGGFLSFDAMDDEAPGALVVPDGVRMVRKLAGVDTVSFYGVEPKIWRGKLPDKRAYADVFQEWMNKVLSKPVSCVYLTGHHWDDHSRAARSSYLSWGVTGGDFHAEFDRDKAGLQFGDGTKDVSVDTSNLRSACRLVLGFGCDVATGVNSTKYQTFFGGSAVVLGWTESINVPPLKGPSVSEHFFEYLENVAATNGKVPKDDRLEWFHGNEPMELVRAWGHATTTAKWYTSQARARDKDGNFWRFKVSKGVAEPVKA
jgi:hypothetical protein